MVKLAQHIEWSSPIPLKTSEGTASVERKKGDRVVANGKPRKTLAELFESRVTSSSSTSASLLSSAPSSSSITTATTTRTPLSVRTGSSLSTSSSTTVSSAATTPPPPKAVLSTTVSSAATTPPPPPPPKAVSSSSSSPTPLQPSASPPPSASTTHAHVTFVDNWSDKYQKHAHTPAAHQSSELSGGIKRSSSARKIADSSRHEGAILRSNDTAKRLSKSGPLGRSEPLPRSPLTNASNSEPSQGISPAKPSNRHNARPNENLPARRSIFGQEKISPSPAATNLRNSEQKNKSPFAKFHIHEHNQSIFLQKSIDTVESLQNLSRFRQRETDPFIDRRLNAENGVDNTPRKEKLRKGLFGLLTDSGMAKDLGGETKGTDASILKFSGNLGKAANTQHAGGKVRDSKSPPREPRDDAITKIKSMDVEIQNEGHLGSRTSGFLGALEECTESTSLTVEIPDKMVGLAWVGAEPRILKPGVHTFPSDKFILEQVVSDRTCYVKHGILHRVHIAEGHLGVAWVDGKAVLLEAGVSVHMCPPNKFSYSTTDEKMLLEKEFVLGPFRVVTVDESEVGIKFCNRQPQILNSGRHCLSISKVEVFAGFESLMRRQSYVSEASAMSSDNIKVSADVWVEWQIKGEDAAAARLANVTDVEGALCSKVRRAFNLVMWEVNAHDMQLQLTTGTGNIANSDPQPLLKSLSLNVCRECQDLFEEGWTVTIWDLQLKHFLIQPEVQNADGLD